MPPFATYKLSVGVNPLSTQIISNLGLNQKWIPQQFYWYIRNASLRSIGCNFWFWLLLRSKSLLRSNPRRRSLAVLLSGSFPGLSFCRRSIPRRFPPLSAINRSFSENVIVKCLKKALYICRPTGFSQSKNCTSSTDIGRRSKSNTSRRPSVK